MSDYSDYFKELFKKNGIEIGSKILIKNGRCSFEGILMPKAAGNPNTIVVKLDNGYNAGILFDETASIKKLPEKTHEIGKKKIIDLRYTGKTPVSLIATGGTISSKIDYKTGGVISLIESEELLSSVPEIADIINIRSMTRPLNKMSEDMDPYDWQTIAENVAKELNSGSEAVIVTHGTDTLHYTAAALSFMLKDLTKPVVLIGSQRSGDRSSADAFMNLVCASHVAVSNIAEVGTCMHATSNDDFCFFLRGTKVRKMHTSRRDAFRPINSKPIAKVWPNGSMEIIDSYKERKEGKVTADTKFEHNIALIRTFPGSDPGVLDYYVSKGCKGFVLEGTGLGHLPTTARKSWIATVKRITESGIPVIVTAQTIYGRVHPEVYTNLRILYHGTNAIAGEDMLSETAYAKLGWVLGHTNILEEVKRLMLSNIAGEITERSLVDNFLN